MNAIDTVKTCITALQSGDIELAAGILSDDFLLTGLAPNPLRKNELLALQGELLTAMPDFSYNLAGIHQEERDVIALTQITGTHTRSHTIRPWATAHPGNRNCHHIAPGPHGLSSRRGKGPEYAERSCSGWWNRGSTPAGRSRVTLVAEIERDFG